MATTITVVEPTTGERFDVALDEVTFAQVEAYGRRYGLTLEQVLVHAIRVWLDAHPIFRTRLEVH